MMILPNNFFNSKQWLKLNSTLKSSLFNFIREGNIVLSLLSCLTLVFFIVFLVLQFLNKHVVEVGLSLLAHPSRPLNYWPYAFQFVVYLINHMPTSLLTQKPHFEHLYHRFPNYSTIHVFNSSCFPFIKPFNYP